LELILIKFNYLLNKLYLLILKSYIFVMGKSYTTSSHLIPQGGNAARVDGRSGVM